MDLLEIRNVSKAYSGHQALRNVSLKIPKQSVFGLLGPNGAGKTTLIRIITQIINQDEGQILLNGSEITAGDVRKIGYMPEERGLYKKMKVGDQLLFLAGLKGLSKSQAKKNIKKWFERLEVEGWWSKKIEDLSKGMGQKIQFIATVMHDPDLIILDEPFSGFDPVNANLIKDQILQLKEQGSTIIFSTHRMESVEEMCDQIAMINQSQKILDGSTVDIKNSFSTNTFSVQHKGEITSLPAGYEIVGSANSDNDLQETQVRILGNTSPNELIKELIAVAEIHSFIEKIPTMNDIFIEKVKTGGNHE